MSSEAFVTLATNDGYGLGALVLAQSIRQVGTKRNLVVLISNHLSDLIRKTLEKNYDEVIVVDELNSNDIEHLNLLSRPELGITFTKINCWLLEQYSKCVFLDADCVVLRSIDDLFEREELSAAPDAGWPDCFNSGVFVYRPSKDTFNQLMVFASQQSASFDGGDQGLLNAFFSNWNTSDISRHLPFTYNVTANAFYSYLPAITRFRNDIHIVHFAGALKPWQLTYNPQNEQLSGNLGGQSDIQRDFLLAWWKVMHQHVWPNINQINQKLNSNNKNLDQQDQNGGSLIGSLNYANLTDNKGIEVGSAAHRRAWESGHIDYYGRDSFQNIEQQLQRNIQQHLNEYHPTQQRQISNDDKPTTLVKTSLPQHVPLPTTRIVSQNVTSTISKNDSKESTILKSSLKGTTTNNVLKDYSTQIPTNPLKSSIRSNENGTGSSNEHESNWTVKSTIVTSYTQGVGEFTGSTVVNKVVSETTATSSNDIPIKTSIKQISDPKNYSLSSKTAKTSNEHLTWLFDKIFVAITYTISLCYLLFLVAIRRSKNTNVINGNGTSVRGVTPSTKNENRVNK